MEAKVGSLMGQYGEGMLIPMAVVRAGPLLVMSSTSHHTECNPNLLGLLAQAG